MSSDVSFSGGEAGIVSTGGDATIHQTINNISYTHSGGLSGHIPDIPEVSLEYYRVNRRPQIDGVKDLLKCGKRPAICVLQGDVEECHDKFLECLEAYWLIQIIPGCRIPKLIHLDWPFSEHIETVRHEIFQQLANEASLSEDRDTPEQFNKKTQLNPVVISTTFFSNGLRDAGKQERIFHQFKDLWKDWPDRKRDDSPLFACLTICYETKASKESLWRRMFDRMSGKSDISGVNKSIRKSIKNSFSDELLSPLEPVEFSDVHKWTGEPDILPRIGGRSRNMAVKDIFVNYNGDRIPMGDLADILSVNFPAKP